MSDTKARVYTLLLLREEGQPDRVVIWDTQDITLGRSPENDLTVNHAEISRRHALFTREDGAYVVKDLSTSNGTRVNGEAIGVHKLKSKDTVRAGELDLEFLRTRQNPAVLGLKLEYASQLKDFGPAQPANAESTMLGLVDSVAETDPNEDSFHVAPARDFEYDLHGMDAPSGAKDLDSELERFGLDELDISGPDGTPPPSQDPWILEEEAPEDLSLPPEAPKGSGESDTAVPALKPAAAPQPAAAEAAAAPPAAAQPVAAQPEADTETLSLHLEIAGLTPDLQRVLRAIEGKLIELPSLKIRVKTDDLA